MSAVGLTEVVLCACLVLACLSAWAAVQGRGRRRRARDLMGGSGGGQHADAGAEGGLWTRVRTVVEGGGAERLTGRPASVDGRKVHVDVGLGPLRPGPGGTAEWLAVSTVTSGGPDEVRADGARRVPGVAGSVGSGPQPDSWAAGARSRWAGRIRGHKRTNGLWRVGRRIGGEWACVPAGLMLGIATWSVVPVGAGVAAVPLVRRALRGRAERAAAERTSAAVSALCGTVAGDLRAGRPPHAALADAVEAAGWPGSPDLGEIARLLLSAARFGGDVPKALRAAGRCGPGAQGLGAVAACWQVAVDGGAGLAAALDRVAGALRAEADQREDLRAQLAGPRSTAVLLALLPVFGLVLGTGLGAEPSAVLLHTSGGLACLVAGALLEWGGLAWTGRIIRGAEEARA